MQNSKSSARRFLRLFSFVEVAVLPGFCSKRPSLGVPDLAVGRPRALATWTGNPLKLVGQTEGTHKTRAPCLRGKPLFALPSSMPTLKNSLDIRLTESVVFLRGGDGTGRHRSGTQPNAPPAMIRGLLTLTLVKPTKISSIEVELLGKTSTVWPEGMWHAVALRIAGLRWKRRPRAAVHRRRREQWR